VTSLDPVPISGRQPRAVRSALAVLEGVVAAGPGVTAKEISAALKLPQATTYRLLNLLVGEEYLVRLPDLRGFALGRRAARLALPVVTTPPAAARAVVEHLRSMVRWGVHLASLRTGQVKLVDRDPDHPPSNDVVLARHPHASALGMLLLADQPDWRAVARELRPLTEHTVTDPGELTARLGLTAAEGVARQCRQVRADRGCIAVPVRELVALLREHAERLVPLLA